MDKPRPCGCKGRRTCIICEDVFKLTQDSYTLDPQSPTYVYCPYCNKCYPGWDMNLYKKHPYHEGEALNYSGIFIKMDFLSSEEHERLIKGIDDMPWDLSQSGRRKQNFGPKCNFKKRKIRLGDFGGFPAFSKFVQDKFKTVPMLKNFQTIEQCSLEYDPEKGASIDPHVDDCWIWGERIVTVNLLSDSVLTLTYNKRPEKYNLDLVSSYPQVLDYDGDLLNSKNNISFNIEPLNSEIIYPVVRVPMPKYSLLVMYGNARYNYEHRIFREDITDRRVCLAYREFTPTYLENGAYFEEGNLVTQKAKIYW
ncbi:alpha-ketoglutarate-dependent dioxygenase alkB homolog 4 [Sitophilus oryzae]|uniref:Alpha-ketoglutarate-dependent dioxygenase alkB homolog 4 n=1 Tax=Sitophilus oryzae TaxID=7048 RepID=A0A6J2YBE9_SITOR|nr:alpha-ketoglutarate-dependent dioxygenase alkB homolog 4 [Sitophilus oryzae]